MPGVDTSPNAHNESGCHGIITQTQDQTFSTMRNDNNDQSRSPDIIEIDPNLTSAPQQPIPAFRGLNSSWLNDDSRAFLSRMRQNNGPGFGTNMLQDLINNPDNVIDVSLSPPDGGQSSGRPTPSSSTSHQNTNSGSRSAANTSPASHSTNNSAAQQAQRDQLQSQFVNSGQGLFDGLGGTGMSRTFGAAETPNKDGNSANASRDDGAAEVPEAFSWDSFTAGVTGGTAVTPMSESVLKTMLSMGPMETMEIFNPQTWTDDPPSGS